MLRKEHYKRLGAFHEPQQFLGVYQSLLTLYHSQSDGSNLIFYPEFRGFPVATQLRIG